MPKFSKKSEEQLSSCCVELRNVFNEVIKIYDCSIVEGRRDRARQNKLFKDGLSKVQYPDGKHNTEPFSDAVDAYPYKTGSGVSYDANECCYFAGIVYAIARSFGYTVRWGGVWNKDSIVKNKFKDLGHFEIVRTENEN